MSFGSSVSAEPPSPEFLSAALRNQLQSGAIEVKYSYIDTSKPDEVSTYRYVRMHGKQYLESRAHNGMLKFQVFDTEQDSGRFLTIEGGDKYAAIASGRWGRDEMGFARLMDPVERVLPEGTLYDLIRTGVVSPEMELVDGHRCWKVEIAPAPKFPDHKYIVFVDPQIGFCPRRTESYFGKGLSIVCVCVLSDYKDIGNGIWYPMSMRIMPTFKGKAASARQMKVDSITIVDEEYVKSLKVDFPSGIKVRDMILDAEYTEP